MTKHHLTPEARTELLAWVERMERNEDAQATGALNKPGVGMCCLGLLTDQLKDKVGLEEVADTYAEYDVTMDRQILTPLINYRAKGTDFQGEGATLPREVKEYLGLKHPTIFVTYRGVLTSVAQLNDRYWLTFPQIAELVREEYEL